MPDQGQLTLLPICPVCRTIQLTNEELAKATDKSQQRCWYCLVETLVQIQSEDAIPEPSEYGRPDETKDNGIRLAKEKMFRPVNARDAIAQMTQNLNQPVPPAPGTPAAPGIKPVLQMPASAIPLSDDERRQFILKFGADPSPKTTPYEIIVHGANEDLFLKLSSPAQIDLSYEREFKRIMGGMVDILGKLLKYGPQLTSTLIELQNISPEMLLGGK